VKTLRKALLACWLLSAVNTALAFVIVEGSDVGDLPSSAEQIDGTGALTSISGQIADINDVDMFRIRVTGAVPVLLQVASSSTVDSQLFVFDANGFAIVGNDDMGLTLDARITAPLVAGIYYLAVSAWDRDPVNAGGLEIFSDDSAALQTPINGGGPIAGYNDFGGLGTYLIQVRGVTGVVPQPGTLLLLSAPLLWLAYRRTLGRLHGAGTAA
jgi:hypothetical protein